MAAVSYKARLKAMLAPKEARLFKRLDSPIKIQNYLDTLSINHEVRGETYMSVRRVIQNKIAHCFEGALFAAAALAYHGKKPLLLDLRTTKHDQDHVVALFRENGLWGAISKTNHYSLRYRDPIFKTLRELALSYFNEYFLENGRKTLRAYSDPFDLRRIPLKEWLCADEELIDLVNALDDSRHHPIVPARLIPRLRKVGAIEQKALTLMEWTRDGRRLM